MGSASFTRRREAQLRYRASPLRIPAAGGEAKPVTAPVKDTTHLYPAFLPDGQRFLYTQKGGSTPISGFASPYSCGGRRGEARNRARKRYDSSLPGISARWAALPLHAEGRLNSDIGLRLSVFLRRAERRSP